MCTDYIALLTDLSNDPKLAKYRAAIQQSLEELEALKAKYPDGKIPEPELQTIVEKTRGISNEIDDKLDELAKLADDTAPAKLSPQDGNAVAPNKVPKVGQSHPSLPVRKNPGDPTHGIFNDKIPLMSGADGGNALEVFRSRIGSLSEDAVTSLKHVEGHAAAEMVSNNLTEAVLHINYKTGPCQYCRRGVSELLGEGQKLWVVFPDGIGYFTNKGWFPQ